MKVLFIDDEKPLLNMLGKFLKKNGYAVEQAENGQDGWQRFSSAPASYQVIIVDIKMPVMDGITFLEQLRKEGFAVPVILMTGYNINRMTVNLESIPDLGVCKLMQKPFPPKVLMETLGELL